jgi:sigma-54 dependent transcriptional regulator, acetoin dehydrogenase operon transcriptional activator AcoR
VLVDHDWPGNVEELERVIREAARRTDLIDVRHLPAEIMSGGSRRLTRIEGFERDEIVRVTSKPGISMTEAASQLGMGRATLYRKIAQYGITIPRSGRRHPSAG